MRPEYHKLKIMLKWKLEQWLDTLNAYSLYMSTKRVMPGKAL